MIRLIASDMDGTLLTPEHRLPGDFEDVLNRTLDRGIIFAAASGRQYVNLADCFPNHLDRIILVSNNGALVRKGEETIYVTAMSDKDRAIIEPIGRRLNHGIFIAQGIQGAYVERPEDRDIDDYMSAMPSFFSKIRTVESFDLVDDTLLNFSVCDFRGTQEHVLPLFQPLSDRYTVRLSGDSWLDISLHGSNKGEALQALQRHYGIRHEETAAFGDFMNDAEMLDHAKYSFAMENAHPDLAKHARFRAPSNRDHGVVKTILQMLDHPNDYPQ